MDHFGYGGDGNASLFRDIFDRNVHLIPCLFVCSVIYGMLFVGKNQAKGGLSAVDEPAQYRYNETVRIPLIRQGRKKRKLVILW